MPVFPPAEGVFVRHLKVVNETTLLALLQPHLSFATIIEFQQKLKKWRSRSVSCGSDAPLPMESTESPSNCHGKSANTEILQNDAVSETWTGSLNSPNGGQTTPNLPSVETAKEALPLRIVEVKSLASPDPKASGELPRADPLRCPVADLSNPNPFETDTGDIEFIVRAENSSEWTDQPASITQAVTRQNVLVTRKPVSAVQRPEQLDAQEPPAFVVGRGECYVIEEVQTVAVKRAAQATKCHKPPQKTKFIGDNAPVEEICVEHWLKN